LQHSIDAANEGDMIIQISTIEDESAYNAYLTARNAPRDTIIHGVRPNSIKTIAEYETLLVSLQNEMFEFADYHVGVVSPVAPFIEIMQCAMMIMRDTPSLINQGARAQGIFPPFGEDLKDTVELNDYAALLTNTVTAIQGVASALQGSR